MCSIAALATCFTLSGLYLDLGGEALKSAEREFNTELTAAYHVMQENSEFSENRYTITIDSYDKRVSNPYAMMSIGYEVNFESVRIDAQAFYRESASVHDTGERGIAIHARWFPFR